MKSRVALLISFLAATPGFIIMKRWTVLALLVLAACASPKNRDTGSQTMITQDQAIEIAMKRARTDEHGMFKSPYLGTVRKHVENGNWVIEIFSEKPSDELDGALYMNVTIDKTSGKVVSVDSGGGS